MINVDLDLSSERCCCSLHIYGVKGAQGASSLRGSFTPTPPSIIMPSTINRFYGRYSYVLWLDLSHLKVLWQSFLT
jgi:hypothetical protein